MGNCLERSRRGHGSCVSDEHCSSKKRAVWAEEKVVAAHRAADKEEEKGETCKRVSEPAAATDQVKIRITRKQLEELLRRVDDDGAQDIPAREVISELLLCDAASSSDDARHHRGARQGQWRPALQSIPE